MASISSRATQRAPQQDRATKRLASFLKAAAELFAEVGYEATTMTAVAERSGSSIGALYNYFPDKQALALALIAEYAVELEAHMKPVLDRASSFSHKQFAEKFLDAIENFLAKHPGYLSLIAGPVRFRRPLSAKKALRISVADAFRAKCPVLSEERALLIANVTVQMVRGMMMLYSEVSAKERPQAVAEFKRALTLYLGSVLRGAS